MPSDEERRPSGSSIAASSPSSAPAADRDRLYRDLISLRDRELDIAKSQVEIELARVQNQGNDQGHQKDVALASIDAQRKDREDERRRRVTIFQWATGASLMGLAALVGVIWLLLHYQQPALIPAVIGTLAGVVGGLGGGYVIGTNRERKRQEDKRAEERPESN